MSYSAENANTEEDAKHILPRMQIKTKVWNIFRRGCNQRQGCRTYSAIQTKSRVGNIPCQDFKQKGCETYPAMNANKENNVEHILPRMQTKRRVRKILEQYCAQNANNECGKYPAKNAYEQQGVEHILPRMQQGSIYWKIPPTPGEGKYPPMSFGEKI